MHRLAPSGTWNSWTAPGSRCHPVAFVVLGEFRVTTVLYRFGPHAVTIGAAAPPPALPSRSGGACATASDAEVTPAAAIAAAAVQIPFLPNLRLVNVLMGPCLSCGGWRYQRHPHVGC